MNPNNNTPQPPLPTDYLDQIAPQNAPKNNFLNNKLLLIGLILCSLIAVALILMTSLSGGDDTKPAEQLYARLIGTQTIAEDATKKIKNTHLSAINSDLKAYLNSAVTGIAEPLENDDITIKKISKKLLETESNKKLVDELEDARLNAVYDRTYPREMAYQLDTILVLMQKNYKSTTNKDLKSFLKDSIKNLEPIKDRLESFDPTQN